MATRARIPARYFGTGENKHRYTAIAVAGTKKAADIAARHYAAKTYPGRKIQIAPFPKGVGIEKYLTLEGKPPKYVIYIQEWLVRGRADTKGESIPTWAYEGKRKRKVK